MWVAWEVGRWWPTWAKANFGQSIFGPNQRLVVSGLANFGQSNPFLANLLCVVVLLLCCGCCWCGLLLVFVLV